MNQDPRIAILWHGDRESRNNANVRDNKFSKVFETFQQYNVNAVPAVYHEDFVEEVRQQLSQVDGVLVWVNPIEGGRNRAILDRMLRDVASSGVFVSTHPDVILKLGTKEVLYQTREMSWGGGDIHLYKSIEELRQYLPVRLANGSSRVLKQNRGNNGNGVWRAELVESMTAPDPDPIVRILHALRDSTESEMRLSEFINQCGDYFIGDGQMIDQPFHSPVPDGMVRCYMTHNQVVGFGHQYVTALLRPQPGSGPLQPQPRIYHPETKPEFQALKIKMETEWIPQLQHLLDVDTESLPVIWDADFLYGPKTASGEDTYVLCEINVSSVHPFPDSALSRLVETTIASVLHYRKRTV
ncbi:Cj0069 family protein [Paenibacillus filicis]|uniref:Cj0069 family protein n=1 Tax=Paenibacillus gyeongsangnamensis TaxID=3388067 RepID=A0ABT4QL75_9BACL|nr:Cj0069 family protein [Paenibacillus filicis]MCZ8517616.1 Cj0069 family protein [Paenibacillus filicis]